MTNEYESIVIGVFKLLLFTPIIILFWVFAISLAVDKFKEWF